LDEKVKEQKERQKRTWRDFVAYSRPHRWLIALIIFLMIGTAATNLLIMTQIKVFVDNVLPNALADKSKAISEVQRIVLNFIVVIAAILLANGIFKGAELYSTSRFGQTILRRLRRDIFAHLQRLSLDFYEGEQTGRIMSYTTADVMKLREFLQLQWPKMVGGAVQVIAYLGYMLYISWKLTLLSFVVFPILIILIHLGARAIRRISIIVQEKLADISRVLQEDIANILVIKSYTGEEREKERFEVENRDTYKAEMRRAGAQAVLIPPMQTLGAIGVGIFLFLGTRTVRAGGELTAGDLVLVVLLLYQLSVEAVKFGRGYFNLQESLAAGDRIFSFLKIKPSIADPPQPERIEEPSGKVSFESVSFSYPTSDEVLREINLISEPGKTIALVGASGAGKTSLVKLIPRLYDVSGGRVLVDGHDVRRLGLRELRSLMGIVPQETVLFSGSVRENIAYGKPSASQDEIETAAKAANAHDFIMALPERYDTLVGERGMKLSGGQAQRVAIARAVLKDPKILILDEATSNLDAESEKSVQAALDRLMVGRTSFVIAHRLSTILNADEIVVMEAGRIIDRGRHEELLRRCEAYRRLYETQLSASREVD
jgi:subfamily B ATP-binding cassette protein MsbA